MDIMHSGEDGWLNVVSGHHHGCGALVAFFAIVDLRVSQKPHIWHTDTVEIFDMHK